MTGRIDTHDGGTAGRLRTGAGMAGFAFSVLALLLAFALLPVAGSAGAAAQDDAPLPAAKDPEGAKAFIAQLSEEAMAVWRDPTLSEAEREKKFRELLYEGFDVRFLARLSLGRHARTMKRDQLREYMKLFPDYIVNKFSKRIGEYTDQKIRILDTAPAGTRDIFVRTELVRPGGEPIAADWRVRRRKDGLRIVDVKVEGISMAITQRDEFSSLIEKSGIEGLLAELRAGAAEVARADARAAADSAARAKAGP